MKNKFQGERVFVTGADGFIGSHLVEALVAAGATVRAFVYYNSWGSLGWLADTSIPPGEQLEIIAGDIRDAERVEQGVRDCRYVFHLASLIGIPYSYQAPRSYVETNVIGTLNILEACRRSRSLVRLIHTSTSEVYGTAQTVPIAESHPLIGQSPYSASKIGAEKLAESYCLAFGVPLVTARPFNTFGPRQTARAVIPAIASQLLLGTDELRLGALTPTRDFNFVSDTVAGLLALAVCGSAEGQAINIGSGEEWSIEKTAELLMEITGRKVPIRCEEARLRPIQSEVNRLLADTSKIKALTDWRPRVPFRDGLSRTVEWIERNLQSFEPSRFAV